MTIEYKNQGFSLTTTNLTTVLTIDASSRALVKSAPITNEHTANILVEAYITDSSAGTDYEFFHNDQSKDTTENMVSNVLVLEEGDSIKVQASVANTAKGVISYALINRSQENG
jgi:hypothetical protein